MPRSRIWLVGVVVAALAAPAMAEPPFDGLPWIWPEIITADDPSSLQGVTPEGRGRRLFWESWRWRTVNVRLFRAKYYDGAEIEVQVHPEWWRLRGRDGTGRNGEPPPYDSPSYEEETATERRHAEVEFVANVIGRLPALYRERILVATLDIGYWPPAANRERQTVHFLSRGNDRMESVGSTEEMYIHEAGHLLEDEYATTPCWRAAQASDGEFISVYAESDPGSGMAGDPSGPGGEDFAETLVAYFALRWRPGRISAGDRRTIRETIPARIRCMDRWGFGAERPNGE